jgi:hypothetical protein
MNQKCSICSEIGATISCAKTKGCNKHFHFPCAYRSGKVKFTKAKEVYCETCNRVRTSGSGGKDQSAPSENDINTSVFPTDYMKKKRLYIVKNLEEVNQSDYEGED